MLPWWVLNTRARSIRVTFANIFVVQYTCTRIKFNFGRAIGIASRLISENTEFNSPHVYKGSLALIGRAFGC